LSVMLIAAERAPTAAGVKVTENVQLPPATTEGPQVLVWVKSPVLAPVMAMPEMDKVALPLFVSVTACEELVVSTPWLPKFKFGGLKLTREEVPTPSKATDCGLPGALSVMEMEAERLAMPVGVNVMLMVQFPPAVTDPPQVLV